MANDDPVKLGVHRDESGRTWLIVSRDEQFIRLTEEDCERIGRWSRRHQAYLRSIERCDQAFERRGGLVRRMLKYASVNMPKGYRLMCVALQLGDPALQADHLRQQVGT